jgi:endonuclease/exonuclease/phosphatase family metal-dependent hydrolase
LIGRLQALLTVMPLIVLAILLGHPTFCAADQPGLPASANTSNDVRVITYNIRYLNRGDGLDHWDNRVDSVAEMMKSGDVIGLQEATRIQIDGLVQRLPEFDWYGVGRDDARDAGEFSPIFWRKDRFKPGQSGTFWLGPDPTAVGKPAWEARLPRICSWVILQPITSDGKPAGAKFAVFNTHFDHQSSLARLNSAKLLLEKIAEISPDLPVVVMGDLNCRPDSQPIGVLTAPAAENDKPMTIRLADSINRSETKPQGPTGTWNGFQQIDPQGRIDYVLVRPDFPRVLSHLTADPKTDAGRFASDHLPVVVVVRL